MDRRVFLETMLAGATARPAAGSPAVAPRVSGAATVQDPSVKNSGENPRFRSNLNADWLFQRQSEGAGELGSFDRKNDNAGKVEAPFREAQKAEYDDSAW